MFLRINLWVLLFLEFFASHSVGAAVAEATTLCVMKFVDKVGSAVFYRNPYWFFANRGLPWTITKAYCSMNFLTIHCRMSSFQPAWPVCATSECWHTLCWHFCSCSSHKTIPSLSELGVTKRWSRCYCYVVFVSIGVTQVWVMMTGIG